MAYTDDKQASGLTAVTSMGATDLFLIQTAGAGDLKKITEANVLAGLDHGGLAGLADDDHPQYIKGVTSFLAANVTSTTDVMAATGLTVNVVLGRKYLFRATLMFSDTSTAAASGGVFDFGGSTAGVTNFRAAAQSGSSAYGFSGFFSTALATDCLGSAAPDELLALVGSFEPSSSGSFALRFSQQTVIDGALTLYRGSSLQVQEVA